MSNSTPSKTGVCQERLARIDTVIQRYMDAEKLPGATVTIARRGQTVYQRAFGWMNVEAKQPMSLDAIFWIMSMSKPVTAVAITMLYEEGYFNLNTPVYEFIPAFKETKVRVGETESGMELADLERPITMRHLYTHTSGLSYGFDPNDPIDQLYTEARARRKEAGIEDTLQNGIEDVARLPLAFQPGTQFRYGMNIDVLGYLVQVISGIPYPQFLQERIFDPLGMTETGFDLPPEKASRVPVLYGYCVDQPGLQAGQALPLPVYLHPGGGLYSTTHDYGRFAQMLVNGGELDGERLLSPKTVALMQMNQAPLEALTRGFRVPGTASMGYGYSLGMQVLMDVAATGQAGSVGEFGWSGAYSTYFWIDRQEELYGLFMTQCSPNPHPIHSQFKTLTYQALE
ncbi:MAG: beta-lactamase family protein [Chloroflexi bacterium]|jgi:CubicO group peptidase (beta-lactamase class C family)|nr:beta-lactamase family protein [Chloroflexota bacterium]